MSNNRKPGGTLGRTNRRKQKDTILYLVQLAILTAVIMVLHFSGAAIPAFGTKISLTLIPIALGAMILGPTAGGILGFIYGLTVYISLGVLHMDAFTGVLFDNNPIMTFLICTVKTTAAGILGGLTYRVLRKKNDLLAVFITAALVPTSIRVSSCWVVS
jgi:thiamine transporter ThiT